MKRRPPASAPAGASVRVSAPPRGARVAPYAAPRSSGGGAVSGQGFPLYLTTEAPCPYLPGRRERRVVAFLDDLPPAAFDRLIAQGWRRSGHVLYRPVCRTCASCIPVRIPVARFRWSRTFRRVWKRNAHLRWSEREPRATDEQYALFRRYVGARHAEGGMDGMDWEEYRALIEDAASGTFVGEFREPDGRLVAVTLSDRTADGLSGVYKFYDPDLAGRSPGTFVVLWHVVRAAELGLPYVYLGYWIPQCPKMAYKARYRPLERLGPGDVWEPLEPEAADGTVCAEDGRDGAG